MWSYQTLIAYWWNTGVSWELQFHRAYVTRAHFSRFNPLMIIVCTGNSPVFARDRTSVWFTSKVAETNVMRKPLCAGCHVNTPPTFKGIFLRHRMQVLRADQRRPSKTFKNTMRADLFSRSHWNKTPRRFAQALWLTKLAYLNMMMHLFSLHGKKKRTHGLYTVHSPVFDFLFRCLCIELAVICDLIPC